jgi:phospholipase C
MAVWVAAAVTCLLPLVVAVAPAGSTPAGGGPCGTRPAAGVTYQHVIWVWMENHSYTDIIGNTAQAPYINSLATSCGLATNYHNIRHPSLPNYIAATSGLTANAVNKFTSDCSPSSTCDTSAPSIFGQGETWKSYEEDMPSNCDLTNAGNYAVRHNPAAYYTTLAGCSTNDVPYTQLASDLAGNTLPAFSFVTPNLVDDMHTAPKGTNAVVNGDTWLQSNVPTILNSSEYQAGTVAVFLTWDEGEGGVNTAICATNTTDVGCHVPTIVISPSTKVGKQSITLYNHWSMLRTTEEMLALPLLGKAATAHDMLKAFGL